MKGKIALRITSWSGLCLWVFDAGAVLLWIHLLYVAFINPLIPWDSWAYHLPFASFLWNIGGGRSAYIPPRPIQYFFEGFPLFAEWLQGALWKLFNDVRATSLINPLALGLLSLMARNWLGVRLFWLICGALAFPLIAIHVTSTYKDLFVGALLAIVVVAATRIYVVLIKNQNEQILNRETYIPWIVFCFTAIAVANSKLTAWLMIIPFIAFAIILFGRAARSKSAWLYLIIGGEILAILCSYNEIANMWRFGNPIFPFFVTTHPLSIVPYPVLDMSPVYFTNMTPDYLGHGLFSQPFYFLSSITEMDWIIRNIPADYSIDMSNGDQGSRQIRTGGLWGIYVCFHLALLLWSIGDKNAFKQWLPGQRFFLQCFGVFTVIIMLLSRSHDLRFVLVWPLLLTILSGIGVSHKANCTQIALYITLLVGLISVQAFFPMTRTLFPDGELPASPQEWRNISPPAIVSALYDHTTSCFPGSQVSGYMWFRYSAAVIGGQHTIAAPLYHNLPCDPNMPNSWIY